MHKSMHTMQQCSANLKFYDILSTVSSSIAAACCIMHARYGRTCQHTRATIWPKYPSDAPGPSYVRTAAISSGGRHTTPQTAAVHPALVRHLHGACFIQTEPPSQQDFNHCCSAGWLVLAWVWLAGRLQALPAAALIGRKVLVRHACLAAVPAAGSSK